jgi:hypothetical protein
MDFNGLFFLSLSLSSLFSSSHSALLVLAELFYAIMDEARLLWGLDMEIVECSIYLLSRFELHFNMPSLLCRSFANCTVSTTFRVRARGREDHSSSEGLLEVQTRFDIGEKAFDKKKGRELVKEQKRIIM